MERPKSHTKIFKQEKIKVEIPSFKIGISGRCQSANYSRSYREVRTLKPAYQIPVINILPHCPDNSARSLRASSRSIKKSAPLFN